MRLMKREFPLSVARCEIHRDEASNNRFTVSSFGPLRGHHVTVFRGIDDRAEVERISKHGLFGTWYPKHLAEEHFQALRELGFKEFALPDGKRHEIHPWPRERRIRA
jgi:hypothetical protein